MNTSARLSIVGTGIRPGGKLTTEARYLLEAADRVLVLVDGLALEVIGRLNEKVESLQDCYRDGDRRDAAYARMVARMLDPLSDGEHVCAAFYGHPGVFVWPAHEAVRQARSDGFQARMFPGISAEDCLFADLGLDPAVHGCQSFEANDFYLHARRFDPTAALILWQPAALGDIHRMRFEADPVWVRALSEALMADYPADHPVIVYEAAVFPLDTFRRESLPLASLHEARFSQVSTLYLPPIGSPRLDPERLKAVGVSADDLTPAAFLNYRNGF